MTDAARASQAPGGVVVSTSAGPAAAPSRDAAPKPGTSRIALLDAVRFVAAFAVVFVHSAPDGWWGKVAGALQFGVSYFVVVGLILLARSIARRPDETVLTYAAKRLAKLVPPMVLWSGIYLVFSYAMFRLTGRGGWGRVGFGQIPWYEAAAGLVLGGAAIHLWFLPFILLTFLVAHPVLRLAHRAPRSRWALLPLALIAGVASALLLPRPADAPGGIAIFLQYGGWTLPTFFLGLALAMVYPQSAGTNAVTSDGARSSHQPASRAAANAAYITIAVGLFLTLAWLSWEEVRSPLIRAGKGLAAGIFTLATLSWNWIDRLAALGKYSFGVYLAHLLFVHLIREVGVQLGVRSATWFVPVAAVAAFAITYALALKIGGTRIGRQLFPA